MHVLIVYLHVSFSEFLEFATVAVIHLITSRALCTSRVIFFDNVFINNVFTLSSIMSTSMMFSSSIMRFDYFEFCFFNVINDVKKFFNFLLNKTNMIWDCAFENWKNLISSSSRLKNDWISSTLYFLIKFSSSNSFL
jgi:hypothetical protein